MQTLYNIGDKLPQGTIKDIKILYVLEAETDPTNFYQNTIEITINEKEIK